MMNRRQFATTLAGMIATPTINSNCVALAQKSPRTVVMHVGGDYHSVMGGDIDSKQNLEYNLRHGVKHITTEFRNRPNRNWDLDELKRIKDNCDRYGMVFEVIR